MDAEFWRQRWTAGQIGFHQAEVNQDLCKLWPELELEKGARVLVPLCGKSHDMSWLVEQGFHVVGVELSQTAVEGYFAEHQLEPRVGQRDRLVDRPLRQQRGLTIAIELCWPVLEPVDNSHFCPATCFNQGSASITPALE